MTVRSPEISLSRHIAREAVVSAVINAVISAGFFFAFFGGMAAVPLWGKAGLVVDAAPQSFMVALMATMVPGLLARIAIGRGSLAPPAGAPTISRVVYTALGMAFLMAGLGVVLTVAVTWGTPNTLPFGISAVAKIAYGAVLGGLVTGWALRRLICR